MKVGKVMADLVLYKVLSHRDLLQSSLTLSPSTNIV